MPSPQIYRHAQVIGTGAYSIVFQAEEVNSGRLVAFKKLRVSQKVKRPILQYESRVLQLIQGHPAIPAIYGYGHLPHFEYTGLELLGPSVKNCIKGPVSVITVTRVVLQMLSALEHIHKHSFVHRDIKPENLLCSSTDSSRVVLIDFGIARDIMPGPPSKYNPLSESKHIVGTLDWASVNSHNGIARAVRQSLFLLSGNLPWRIDDYNESFSLKASMRRVHAFKVALSSTALGVGFLDYSHRLGYNQMPDHAELIRQFTDPNRQVGVEDP